MNTFEGKRFAAIDIGSNAIRLLIVSGTSLNDKTRIKQMTHIRLPIRLGSDVFGNGRVSSEKETSMIHALHGFSLIMKAYKVDKYKACATSAMRDASNGPEIMQHVKELAGINVEIIQGTEEADYIFKSVLDGILDKRNNYLYIDVGGGSTELTLIVKGKKMASSSFQLGTVRILQGKDPITEWERLHDFLKEHVEQYEIDSAIGSGGNISKLQKLAGNKKKRTIKTSDLKDISKELSKLSYEERMNEYDLKYDRADVIIPASRIFLSILEQCNIKETMVPKIGLADGLVMDMITRAFND